MYEKGGNVCWRYATNHAGLSDILGTYPLEVFSGFGRKFGDGRIMNVFRDQLVAFGSHVFNLAHLSTNKAFIFDSNLYRFFIRLC